MRTIIIGLALLTAAPALAADGDCCCKKPGADCCDKATGGVAADPHAAHDMSGAAKK